MSVATRTRPVPVAKTRFTTLDELVLKARQSRVQKQTVADTHAHAKALDEMQRAIGAQMWSLLNLDGKEPIEVPKTQSTIGIRSDVLVNGLPLPFWMLHAHGLPYFNPCVEPHSDSNAVALEWENTEWNRQAIVNAIVKQCGAFTTQAVAQIREIPTDPGLNVEWGREQLEQIKEWIDGGTHAELIEILTATEQHEIQRLERAEQAIAIADTYELARAKFEEHASEWCAQIQDEQWEDHTLYRLNYLPSGSHQSDESSNMSADALTMVVSNDPTEIAYGDTVNEISRDGVVSETIFLGRLLSANAITVEAPHERPAHAKIVVCGSSWACLPHWVDLSTLPARPQPPEDLHTQLNQADIRFIPAFDDWDDLWDYTPHALERHIRLPQEVPA